MKETKELFEKWKSFTDSKNKNISIDELRQYTRSKRVISVFIHLDLLSQLDDMENLISELTRCMGIIEKNRDSNRFRYIDNVLFVTRFLEIGGNGETKEVSQ